MGAPYQDIAFLFHHDKMDTGVLMFTHEGMRNQMKEDVREETTSLPKL